MMPVWLTVLLALFPVAVGIVMGIGSHVYRQGIKARDQQLAAMDSRIIDGFRRNDESNREQKEITSDLRDKVGVQNGRIGKLEMWREGHDKWSDETRENLTDAIKGLEDRARSTPVRITKPSKSRKKSK
jgi:hypothetical protein